MYVFSEASTRHAISRSCYREFQKGDIVQLNLSAKIDGYSAAIGYPICLGKLEGERRDIVQFCRQAHQWTCEQVKADVMAGDIAKKFYQYFVDQRLQGTTSSTARCTPPASSRSKRLGRKPAPCIRSSLT